ncbi:MULTISPECIES: MarR family winged helix-turn-helix transcriptional regulator [Psychrilyobacter]|uniref:MarR family transcriptional regulator n=1 Tax=Psychrilyobacter piezotolerans TaxID=2293438 RepID=A0ABX9KFU0_9FUSO|nr:MULTISPECIES: MarR family winged helix-turn-helix transcriptional regulator [Psychrilyobacter]MCS5420884.1 MarR family winged helix-turn-helix transcriptional regulator [Psychrilyobacter sp. S5]NDI78555.1 winged helix-turn-helix transcriptional regulator [Psychrilyobacter piezotolerans]RDE60438.1 MarR family transcriptional regulator [Psychrilyobacter sp. S5]REI40468.1 MarR family transcriptional regulator [Psychrilyobacter piezotolerans]
MKEHLITMALSSIERDYNYYMNKKLKQYNIGKHEIRALKVINQYSGLSQNEVCSILKEDKITVSKAVKNLEKQGYINKVKDLEDKRIYRLYITEKGSFDRKDFIEITNNINQIFSRGLSDPQKTELLKLLDILQNNIQEEADKLRKL